jgi:hypothetical protein
MNGDVPFERREITARMRVSLEAMRGMASELTK